MSSAETPVDIAHLDRYTGGDRAINEEVLQLFENSCNEILAGFDAVLENGLPPEMAKQWRDSAHTLKGAARGIGAFDLADAAAVVEDTGADRMAAIEALQRLKAKAAVVHAFIQDFLGRRA
jgi:HPt (histidine-containing phosphotransfer) domain-containing protein